MKELTSIIFFCFLFLTISAQEICNNGIDDDGDGLIDLNDALECACGDVVPSGLIPNPSFEEKVCCPTENEQLSCAIGWIQASAASTDYVHTCGGYLGNTAIPAFAPLPFPDGNGGVGFRDGQAFIGSSYKEYVGACLIEQMEIGTTYRLDFYVGFQNNVEGSMSFDIALFASADCGLLPFAGNSNFDIGCPTNVTGYTELDQKTVSGSNQWVNVIFEFVAQEEFEVIILGPSCEANPNYMLDPYFFIDRLALAEITEFDAPDLSTSGTICDDNLLIQIADDPENNYQWYVDGIALVGETNASLSLNSMNAVAGNYQVYVNAPSGCGLSQIVPVQLPPYIETATASICNDEYVVFNMDTLTETGFYEEFLIAFDGCDSIAQLDLEVRPVDFTFIEDTICENTVYLFNGIELLETGVYDSLFVNSLGCDSLVTLSLTQVSLGIGIDIAESVSVNLGEIFDLYPNYVDNTFTQFLWTDDEGIILGEEPRVKAYQPLVSTTVYLDAGNDYGCSVRDRIQINVLPNYEIFIPNAFSPDGNSVNDFFRFYPPISVARVKAFSVFSRWGELVFRNENIENFVSYEGWDGLVNGKNASIGVYTYLLEVEYLDGVKELLSGDVVLLR